jgi:SNF2 family DNA or RNA helicase
LCLITCHVTSNVFRKTKALQKFKGDESEVKVILLSLSKAASGTNLIEASHVLLMGEFHFGTNNVV